MGTTVIPEITTRKEMVEHLKADYLSGDYTLLDSSQSGNILYFLVHHPDHGRFIAVFKLSGSSGRPGDEGWGYKPMTESMGPCYYGCPERILAQSEDTGEDATRWREECRQRRRDKAARKQWVKTLRHGTTLQYLRGYDKDGPRYVEVVFERPHSPTFFIGHFAGETQRYRMRWEQVKAPVAA